MADNPTLQFLGAAGTVTGSKFLVTVDSQRVLLDCGLFQGLKELRLRNWRPPSFDPADVDAVVLSHAHIDHSGYLPLLARKGFRGPIHCTPGSQDLLRVLLLDAAHIQEEEAARANRYGYSKHKPALPLYTTADAEAALALVEPHPYGRPFAVGESVSAILRRAGHILGSATIELDLGTSGLKLVDTGDLGRGNRPILRDPDPVTEADILLVESTYGDRVHAPDPAETLARIVRESAARGGALLVPAFAVGRTQEVIWTLRQLEDAGRVPVLPVYIDSPMAINVTDLYCRHPEDHNLDMKLLMDEKRCPLCCKQYHLARTPQESKALNARRDPIIIISASGMATGGRILHHLKERLPDEHTTVLLPGFQVIGTRGRALQDGARSVRIHGQSISVRARIETLGGLSAHADRDEIIRWLRGFTRPPRQVYVVHGEPHAAQSLAVQIRAQFGWNVRVAEDGGTVSL
jgi:metallo-beta-lactamase family protein